MRRFVLNRVEDPSGISGIGTVAAGVRFPDDTIAMRWLTGTASTSIYACIEDVVEIHGHGGLTVVEWLD